MHDGGGKDDDLCRYVVLLCVWVSVCACLHACVGVPMRMCTAVDGLFVLGFSHLVCLYVCLWVCVGGGGGGCMDRCVSDGVFVREWL